ncbi:hypothetical protein RN001_000725 [Aquatica leii]|uniref:Uncharacterized protein n=1 Tax=Aquatica leii TaxID=1421715 RepID=A0AAN7PFA8_9COLE|nr:hypothetical protein RN001_000725 [Aquatica leii]
MFYGLPLVECRKLAYEMAVNNDFKMPENLRLNEMAGKDWMYRCSLSRATSFNPHNVKIFFDNLKIAMDRNQRFSDGTRIFNLDETGTVTEDIRGYPKAGERKTTGKERKKGRNMILTDTPEKAELEERYNKRQKPVQAQKKIAVKRKIAESDEEEEKIEWHSDASSDNFVPKLDPTLFKELDRDPQIADYVLVKFTPQNTKGKISYYIERRCYPPIMKVMNLK